MSAQPRPTRRVPSREDRWPRENLGQSSTIRGLDQARCGRSGECHGQRGAVTAEFAVALPAVVLTLAFLLAGGAAGITQLRLEEAARAGARAVARGEDSSSVQGIVQRIAGPGAQAGVVSGDGWLTVTAASRAGGALGAMIPWTLNASASAREEATDEGASG